MYYHTTSAFERPEVMPEQIVQTDQGNESKRIWILVFLVAGALLAAGILIGNAIGSDNHPLENKESNRY